ncbi:MAG: M23 family metallopeptidase [Alphaproteobacteria bacterium]|nr:M23 family metallopeptidase [Alphaproteobacteria bacterium]
MSSRRDSDSSATTDKHPWLAAAGMMAGVLLAVLGLIGVASSLSGGTPAASFAWLTPAADQAPAIVPGNVESAEDEAADAQPETRQIAVQSGDTLTEILIDAGADPSEARAAVAALSSVYDASTLREGQFVTVTFDALPPGSSPQTPAPAPLDAAGGAAEPLTLAPTVYAPLLNIAIKASIEREVFVTRGDDGSFAAREVVKQLKATDARATGTIEGSLYLSAKAAGVPESVIVDLIRIYSYDVDFQREVRSGDKFDLLYTNYVDETGDAVKGGAIQFAELTLKGERKPLYRFTTSDDQTTDYFTPKGWSGKRMLMRTPIDGARLTSGFGMRFHPILGYTKMHKGVDFGAATGTPVMASGNGVVEMADWFGGYGRYVRIKHVNSYSTAYAHLSRFARGIKSGTRVRQGQVVGYVGTSGRSTGPHLHYEVMVKAKQINPMGVKLPTGRSLAGRDLAAFQADVTRITELLQTMPAPPALVAQSAQTQALSRP